MNTAISEQLIESTVKAISREPLSAASNGGEPRQLRFDLVDGVDDVGAGLLVDVQQNAGLVVLVGGNVSVGCLGDRVADIAHANWSAVAVGQNDVVEEVRLGDLVVG